MLASDQLLHTGRGSTSLALAMHLAGLGVDDVMRQDLAVRYSRGTGSSFTPESSAAHVARSDAAAFLDDDLIADANVENGGFAAQTCGTSPHRGGSLV